MSTIINGNKMNVIDTDIPDVKIFEPKIFGDDRGFFYESFKKLPKSLI